MKPWPRIALVIAIVSTILIPTKAFSVGTNPTAVCTSGTCTVTFTSISDYYSWSAPKADTYTLEVWGAQGGNAGYNGTVATYGGLGGYSTGALALTSNQAIYIYVGAQGSGATGNGASDSLAGGYNGGGLGYNGTDSTKRGAGGGGGSDIRIGGNTLSNRVIVAGGGGGAVSPAAYGTNTPGFGGGTSGGNGSSATFPFSSYPQYHGKGGSQSAGGGGGANGSTATGGVLGIGGDAGYAYGYGEGGGGGGYYGGGGSGTGMGSGGGSGYIGGVSSAQTIAGNATMPNPAGGNMTGRSGNGLVRISYTDVPLTSSFSSFSLTSGANPPIYRTSSILTAVVSVPSKVTFKVNNVIIPGCKGRQTTGGAPSATATCSWKPSTRGSAIVSAIAAPNNVATSGSSANIAVAISSRAGKR